MANNTRAKNFCRRGHASKRGILGFLGGNLDDFASMRLAPGAPLHNGTGVGQATRAAECNKLQRTSITSEHMRLWLRTTAATVQSGAGRLATMRQGEYRCREVISWRPPTTRIAASTRQTH